MAPLATICQDMRCIFLKKKTKKYTAVMWRFSGEYNTPYQCSVVAVIL